VVQKWAEWIKTASHEDSKWRLTSRERDNEYISWMLRYEEEQRTDDMPKFMQIIAATSLPAEI
jgi:hypothetical protein